MSATGTNFGIFRPNSSNNYQTPNITQQEYSQLNSFILQLEDYVPTIPDAITAHYLNSAGFDSSDPRVIRLISIVTQKFISDVANDALQISRTRTICPSAIQKQALKATKDRKYTLTVDDLAAALADYGITVRKPHYFP